MTQPNPKNPPKLPELKIPEDLKPQYVNVVRITHSPSEMVMDFAQVLPGGMPPQVVSRLLMSPLSAKLFHRALGENLAKYEANFGEIKVPGGTSSLAEHLFRPPQK
jgi:hypothetical protein